MIFFKCLMVLKHVSKELNIMYLFFNQYLQASTQKKYPVVLLAVLYQFSLSAVMSAIFALIVVKDASAWKLKLDMGLVSILYIVRSLEDVCFLYSLLILN